jgi:hypothetical protein
MGQGSARVYNFISILFLLLSFIVLMFVIFRMAGPAAAVPTPVVSIPTALVLPTVTPTDTPTNTPLPTWTNTPSPTNTPLPTDAPTLTPSNTPPPSATFTPTFTASNTYTAVPSQTITDTIVPSLTPNVTDTPTETPTLDFTSQPTEPPPSPFPFDLKDGQVIFTTNFANTAGCAWQGIGGQVFDMNDQPLTQIRVHVFGSGVDTYAVSGSNTLYGISGWEIPVSNVVNNNTYLVELQTSQGTIISQQVQVLFVADCSRNLALVNFKQTRPF